MDNQWQTETSEGDMVSSCSLFLTLCMEDWWWWCWWWWWWWWWWWREQICGSRKEQEDLFVNSVLMVKATTELQSNVLLTDLSKQACDLSLSKDTIQQISICISLFLLCTVCFSMQVLLHKSTMKPEPYVCSLFAPHDCLWYCLESRGKKICVVSSLWGQLKETKPSQKVQPVRFLSIIRPFHYELWFDPFSCCLCCFVIQYRPPQPPQGDKASHTA